MLRLDVESVDVIEAAIVRLRYNGQPPRLLPGPLYLPLQNSIVHDAHAVCVRDRDGTFQKSALLQPRGARHLAVAVEREPGTKHGIGVRLAPWMDHRDTRAHGPLPYHERPAAGNEGGVTHLDARHIRDGVE